MFEVGFPVPLSWRYHLDFGSRLLILRQQSVQSRVVEVLNVHTWLDIPDCSYSRGNSVVLGQKKQMDWKTWRDSWHLRST